MHASPNTSINNSRLKHLPYITSWRMKYQIPETLVSDIRRKATKENWLSTTSNLEAMYALMMENHKFPDGVMESLSLQ